MSIDRSLGTTTAESASGNSKSPWKVIQTVLEREIDARKEGVKESDRMDFLAKSIDLHKAGRIDNDTMMHIIGHNVIAGSDTTGISLTALVYYLMKNPACLQRLRGELDAAAREGTISDPITFTKGQKLPYLQATIKEALRLHPAVGQILSRVVPKGGAELVGTRFPKGTIVGINPWLIHYDKNIWGQDVAEFKPERWLVDKKRLAFMEQNFLAFGAGARTCIGKNISLLKITKVLPQLVQKFDFVPVGNTEWTTLSGWFVKQKIQVRVCERGVRGE